MIQASLCKHLASFNSTPAEIGLKGESKQGQGYLSISPVKVLQISISNVFAAANYKRT